MKRNENKKTNNFIFLPEYFLYFTYLYANVLFYFEKFKIYICIIIIYKIVCEYDLCVHNYTVY